MHELLRCCACHHNTQPCGGPVAGVRLQTTSLIVHCRLCDPECEDDLQPRENAVAMTERLAKMMCLSWPEVQEVREPAGLCFTDADSQRRRVPPPALAPAASTSSSAPLICPPTVAGCAGQRGNQWHGHGCTLVAGDARAAGAAAPDIGGERHCAGAG
jgi:hypothetical protein